MCYMVVGRKTGEFLQGISEGFSERQFGSQDKSAQTSPQISHTPQHAAYPILRGCVIFLSNTVLHVQTTAKLQKFTRALAIRSCLCYVLPGRASQQSRFITPHWQALSRGPLESALVVSETRNSLQNPFCGPIAPIPSCPYIGAP